MPPSIETYAGLRLDVQAALIAELRARVFKLESWFPDGVPAGVGPFEGGTLGCAAHGSLAHHYCRLATDNVDGCLHPGPHVCSCGRRWESGPDLAHPDVV